MANVRPQIQRAGARTRNQILKVQRPALARDDLREAFAGDENEFARKPKDATRLHSTNVKSRKRRASREKTPKR